MKQPHARMLVVDDERNIRKNLSLVLEAEGYEVDVASDGESALAKARERHYDIAFVDLHMPHMGGLDLTRSLRAFSGATAIVILTAYGSVEHAVAAMKLGAVDFLEKPFDPKNIRLLVEEILLRQRLGSGGSARWSTQTPMRPVMLRPRRKLACTPSPLRAWLRHACIV